eukprot:313124-Pyramimonas_sp.AAC.1
MPCNLGLPTLEKMTHGKLRAVSGELDVPCSLEQPATFLDERSESQDDKTPPGAVADDHAE